MPRWFDEYKKGTALWSGSGERYPRQLRAVLQATISMLATDEAFLCARECVPRSRFELMGNKPAL